MDRSVVGDSDDRMERISEFARDLASGALRGLWEPTFSVVMTGDGSFIWHCADELQALLGNDRWKDDIPSPKLLASFGYFSIVRTSKGATTYILTEKAYALLGGTSPAIANDDSSRPYLTINPLFGEPDSSRSWPQIFVMMPFGSDDLDEVYQDHIVKVAKELGVTCERADDESFLFTEAIIRDIWSAIYHADLCIADLTGRNENVFYELGIAHTLGKPCILIQSGEGVPFDVNYMRIHFYRNTSRGMSEFEELLRKLITNELNRVGSVEERRFSTSDPGHIVMTPDDVLREFARVPDLSTKSDEVNFLLQRAYQALKANGIDTRKQLRELVTSSDVLQTLRNLYIEELNRPEFAPLDTMAVATWGAWLYVNRVTPETVSFLRSQLRQSGEYKDIHNLK